MDARELKACSPASETWLQPLMLRAVRPGMDFNTRTPPAISEITTREIELVKQWQALQSFHSHTSHHVAAREAQGSQACKCRQLRHLLVPDSRAIGHLQ